MILDIFLDSKIELHRIMSGVAEDHCLAMAVYLLSPVVKEVVHDHLDFLLDGEVMGLVVSEKSSLRVVFKKGWVLLGVLYELKCLLDSHVVLKDVENETFLNGLFHGIDVERMVFSVLFLSSKGLKRLPNRSCREGEE